MNLNLKTTILGAVSFCMFSCDSLLTTPPLDQIPDEAWWSNKQQVDMMVDNAYTFLDGPREIIERDTWSDNATHRNGDMKEIGNCTYTTHSRQPRYNWRYDAIARLNYILEGLENAKNNITENEYLQRKAQVQFIRAYVYYNMLFKYGDIPLITKTLTVAESRETSRQPRQEVLNFVMNELENEILPNIEKVPVKESGRINKEIVEAFLTRVCLYEKDYEKTITYADAVINSKKYELYPDYDALFRPQTDGKNKEVIFERQYSAPLYTHEMNRNLSYIEGPYSGWSHVLILQGLVDEYECIGGHDVSKCEELGCKYHQKRIDVETPTHRGEYDFRDPRLAATVIWPFREWKVGDKVRSVYRVDDPNGKDFIQKETHMSGFLCNKWLDLEGEFIDRTRSQKNLTMIRYADILLMKAEALIELGKDLPTATALINQIRARVNMPEITGNSQADLREKLRHERRVEFALEGTRYNDIIRWRIADKVKKGKVYGAKLKSINPSMSHKFMEERHWNDKMYLFPIPQEAIDNNPNLTQNPGW